MQVTAAAALRSMLEIERTALLVVDVQADFAAPDGALAAMGADLSGVEPAIDRMLEVIAAARARNMRIVFLRVLTRPETDSGALQRFNARRGLPPAALELCRIGTPGSDYYRVQPAGTDLEVGKRLYSGFHGTRLEETLRAHGIAAVIIMGLTTECCVDATARDAFHSALDVFIVADACAAYDLTLHTYALENLSRQCALLTTAAATCEALRADAR